MSNIVEDAVEAAVPGLSLAKIVIYGLVILAILGAGAAGGYVARGLIDAPALSAEQTATAKADLAMQQCHTAAETSRANANGDAVQALNKGIGDVNAAIALLNEAQEARDKSNSTFLKELANAPKSSICLGSAAERAYRNSVQSGPAVGP